MKTALCLILLALPMSALAAPITEECILSKELYEHFKQLSLHGFQVETPSENNDNEKSISMKENMKNASVSNNMADGKTFHALCWNNFQSGVAAYYVTKVIRIQIPNITQGTSAADEQRSSSKKVMLNCTKKLEEGLQTITELENKSGKTTELYHLFKQLSLTLLSQTKDNCETDFMDVQDFLSKLKEFISDVQRQFCP